MNKNKMNKETEQSFARHWNSSSNRKEVASKMDMTIDDVKKTAWALRRRNVFLKRFSSRPYRLARRTDDPTPEQIKERAEKIRQNW